MANSSIVAPGCIVGDVRLRTGQILRNFELRPGTAQRTLADVMPGAVWLGKPKNAAATSKATAPAVSVKATVRTAYKPPRVTQIGAVKQPTLAEERAALAKRWDEVHARMTRR